MSLPPKGWRAPVTGAVTGLAVAAAIVGPSALASSGSSPSKPSATKAAQAAAACRGPQSKAPAGGSNAGPGPGPFLAAVARLQQAGTINAAQARVIDADIRAGSIDSNQLVANGTLTSAQMRAVMDRLGAVKRSLAPASPPSRAGQTKAPHG